MNKIFVFFAIIFVLLSASLYAQENAIAIEINKTSKTIKGAINIDEKSADTNYLLCKGWSIGCNYGVTQFRGDINEGFFKSSSFGNNFHINFQKKMDKIFTLGILISKGNLNGERYNESYQNSQSIEEVYDPHDGYSGIGEHFVSDFTSGSFLFHINMEQLIMKLNKKYVDSKSFSLSYNLGGGIMLFRSLKTNIDSDSFIYGYGYGDPVDGVYDPIDDYMVWPTPDPIDPVKEGIFIYGPTFSYHINDKIQIDLSSLITYLVFSDYLDASDMDSQPRNDRFRTISLGLKYNIN
jgi:hypothetical protein